MYTMSCLVIRQAGAIACFHCLLASIGWTSKAVNYVRVDIENRQAVEPSALDATEHVRETPSVRPCAKRHRTLMSFPHVCPEPLCLGKWNRRFAWEKRCKKWCFTPGPSRSSGSRPSSAGRIRSRERHWPPPSGVGGEISAPVPRVSVSQRHAWAAGGKKTEQFQDRWSRAPGIVRIWRVAGSNRNFCLRMYSRSTRLSLVGGYLQDVN
jgi:hypothetical protein